MGCGASTVKNPPPEELKAKIVAATSPKKVLPEEVKSKHLDSGTAQAHASATSETTAPANKDVSPAGDDDLSRTSTQGSCSGTPLATPKGDKPPQSAESIPQSVAPLPAPLDVDAIELPCRDPDAVPHWERESQPATADTAATRRCLCVSPIPQNPPPSLSATFSHIISRISPEI